MSESGTVDPSEGALESDFQKRMDESWVRAAFNFQLVAEDGSEWNDVHMYMCAQY